MNLGRLSRTRRNHITARSTSRNSSVAPASSILPPPKPTNSASGRRFRRDRIRLAACKSPLGSPAERKIRTGSGSHPCREGCSGPSKTRPNLADRSPSGNASSAHPSDPGGLVVRQSESFQRRARRGEGDPEDREGANGLLAVGVDDEELEVVQALTILDPEREVTV